MKKEKRDYKKKKEMLLHAHQIGVFSERRKVLRRSGA